MPHKWPNEKRKKEAVTYRIKEKIEVFKASGGKVEILPEETELKGKVSARFARCKECVFSKKTEGLGTLECKKCIDTKTFHLTSSPRPPMIFEDLDKLIEEAWEENSEINPKLLGIADYLRHVPQDEATLIFQYCFLNMSFEQIAEYNKKRHPAARKNVSVKLAQAVERIRGMIYAV